MCRATFAFFVLVACIGCGRTEQQVFPVTGTIKLADGTPATGCIVEFSSQAAETKGLNARGEVQADGSYKLTTTINGKEKEGAVAGPHNIVVVAPATGSSGGPPPLPIASRYAEYANSGLSLEVKPGETNTFSATLDPK